MSTPDITIGKLKIGNSHRPIIIAEMSGNHNQSLDKACKIIQSAKDCGADIIKFQTYTPDTMTLNLKRDEFLISNTSNEWEGMSLYECYEKAHTPWEWHKPLLEYCKKIGITWLSSPFDLTAVDFLRSLDAPAYKIASLENTDLPLIRAVAATGKPVIISSGTANITELGEAVEAAKEAGCKDLILLKCTCTYPAPPENSNLLTIPHMQNLFNTHVGLSDHTLGIGTSIGSIALGAKVIEKHFTLTKDDDGIDGFFSLAPNELKSLVEESERCWQSLGNISYGISKKEKEYHKMRRSLYIVEDIKSGESLNPQNLRSIRPGLGLPGKYYHILIGKKVNKDVKKGTAMHWNLLN